MAEKRAVLMNPRVFWGASLIIALLLMVGIVFPERADELFGRAQAAIVGGFGWFYILAVAGFLFAVVFLGLSRYGQLKLGPDDSEPDYSYLTWLAMLFAAGMGIGLMFFAVAEPIQHFSVPPEAEAGTLAAARQAMVITFFHWGVHAWGIYAVVGLSLAYFSFRYNLPLTVRSGLYPLLHKKIDGPIGDMIDIFAVCGTLFGVATSLGFGVLQINAGLNYVVGLPQTPFVQVVLIAVVTGLATLSVVSGLDVGIRRLSELNLILAIVLMLFVLVAGPTGFLLNAFAQNLGGYLDNFFVRTFNIYAYRPREWMASWTLFYWAWWIAWSPFVGMFIARISRGRTVREFVIGVLLVPATFTFLWMTIFGNTAISLDMAQAGQISAAVAEDVSTALFKFLEHLPMATVTSVLAVVLVAVFFVTSSDSASMVIDTIAAGGAPDTPVWQRIYWCSLEGVAAALLLLAGGLSALQTMTLISALPFTVIMILLVIGLVRGMRADMSRSAAEPPAAVPAADLHWRKRLSNILHTPGRADVRRFLDGTVEPALREVAQEMAARGEQAEVTVGEDGAVVLTVPSTHTRNFVYGVQPVRQFIAAFSAAQTALSDERRPQVWLARTAFSDGSRGYDVMGYTQAQLIADVLTQYERYRLLVSSAESALYIRSPEQAAT